MEWLFAEDAAVKTKFAGLTVKDINAPAAGRPVSVRFVNPETALSELTFPVILIQRTNMARMPEREHRGGGMRVPKDMVYQITVMCRRADHTNQLAAALADESRLSDRFAYVEVPEDGTVRSLFVDGGPEFTSTKDQDGKRLLQIHYNIRIPTEGPPVLAAQPTEVATVDMAIGLK